MRRQPPAAVLCAVGAGRDRSANGLQLSPMPEIRLMLAGYRPPARGHGIVKIQVVIPAGRNSFLFRRAEIRRTLKAAASSPRAAPRAGRRITWRVASAMVATRPTSSTGCFDAILTSRQPRNFKRCSCIAGRCGEQGRRAINFVKAGTKRVYRRAPLTLCRNLGFLLLGC
jgi:hypothetical protein